MEVKRKYKGKDVEMLLAAATIVKNAMNHKEFLQSKRTTWGDPFFGNLDKQINEAIKEYLGYDSAKKLRESSQQVYDYVSEAKYKLAEVKVQLQEDFRSDKPRQQEILTNLGFSRYGKAIRNNDQEAIIAMLYQFKTNLVNELKKEIVKAGTANQTLQDIIALADKLKAANVNQESDKSGKKAITAEAIMAFNAVYMKTIAVARIAANLTKEMPGFKDQFNFAKTIKSQNSTGKSGANASS